MKLKAHQTYHPEYQPDCFACRLTTVSFNMSPEAKRVDTKEAQWRRDMDAYRAVRRQGLQPRRIDGVDQLAAEAADPLEIRMGRKLPGTPAEVRGAIERGQEISEEMGLK